MRTSGPTRRSPGASSDAARGLIIVTGPVLGWAQEIASPLPRAARTERIVATKTAVGRARHADPPHHRLDDQFEPVVVPSLCDWPSPLWEGSVTSGVTGVPVSGEADSEKP